MRQYSDGLTSDNPSPRTGASYFIRLIAFGVVIQSACILYAHRSVTLETAGFDLAWMSESNEGGSPSEPSHRRRHAYAFLMAGCDNDNLAYRGYLYNVLVGSDIFQTSGSKADVVVLIRMSAKAKTEKILAEDEHLLRKSGVIIQYLPKSKSKESDSFYTAMLDKFWILELVQYSRVIFMDSDVIPLCNLDYIFELSDPDPASGQKSVLKENLVLAYKTEPAQGGFFMMKPGAGEFAELQEVIRIREERAKDMPWPPFDEVWGWGHVIVPPDSWVRIDGPGGTNWTFYGAFADQGLLYHWVKYVKRSVSIVIKGSVQNWSERSVNGTISAFLESTTEGVLDNASCSESDPYDRGWKTSSPPYRDFHHFTGKKKPWLWADAPEDFHNGEMGPSPGAMWYHTLRKVKAKYNMALNVEKLALKPPPLGLWPTHWEMHQQSNEKITTVSNQTSSASEGNKTSS
mmetsp:Transcript_33610/g.100194  ORF Transcript_33610/g.100194 Transcript_33610/m.100194 type:complete len:459 (-) Transcript_33610:2288-3664(-)